jgi:hypothetical protein
VSRSRALPDVQLIQPVLTKPFHRDGWVYEEKYDGWRMVAYKDGRDVRLFSRRCVDHTERFADIAAAVRRLSARTLVLDGEVCVSDERLISHTHLLMEPPADGAVVTPPVSSPSTSSAPVDVTCARGREVLDVEEKLGGRAIRLDWMRKSAALGLEGRTFASSLASS